MCPTNRNRGNEWRISWQSYKKNWLWILDQGWNRPCVMHHICLLCFYCCWQTFRRECCHWPLTSTASRWLLLSVHYPLHCTPRGVPTRKCLPAWPLQTERKWQRHAHKGASWNLYAQHYYDTKNGFGKICQLHVRCKK